MIIRRCSKCKTEGKGNFCSKCGGKLVLINQCPQCEVEVELTDRFCCNCGAELDKPKVRIPQMRTTLHL